MVDWVWALLIQIIPDVSGDGRTNGNVGIGIAPDNTSTYKLKVDGSTKVSGDIDLPYGGNITLPRLPW